MIIINPAETLQDASNKDRIHALFEVMLLTFLNSGQRQLEILPECDGYCRCLLPSSDSADDFPPMPGHLTNALVSYFSDLFGQPASTHATERKISTTGKQFTVLSCSIMETSEKYLIRLAVKENLMGKNDCRDCLKEYFQLRRQEMTLFERAYESARSFIKNRMQFNRNTDNAI